jgi:hypothetical protein
MLRKAVLFATLLVAVAAVPARAQMRVEAAATFGWTFSDGVSGDAILAGDGQLYDRVDPKDSFSWNLRLGIVTEEHVEFGFLYGRQESTMVLQGTATRELGSMPVTNYHGYVGYNFGEADAKVRPYLFFGLGATNYGQVSFTAVNGVARQTASQTQFSSTFGAGVKAFFSPHAGIQAGMRWTPTYIKSDPGGWWCDPYWGCYVVGSAQYSNQFELSGGVVFRF